MSSKSKGPRKSLRTILIIWFLVFSIIPLFFLTGVSMGVYEKAIDQELSQRLEGNRREIEGYFAGLQENLMAKLSRHVHDHSLIYHLSLNAIPEAAQLVERWMGNSTADRLHLFNREGRLEVALFRDASGQVNRVKGRESTHYYLPDEFLAEAREGDLRAITYFQGSKAFDLIVFGVVRNSKGLVVGYIEEMVRLDKQYLENFRKQLGVEIVLFPVEGEGVVATHEDLEEYRSAYFRKYIEGKKGALEELNIREVPFGFTFRPIKWGEQGFNVALGVSKEASRKVLKTVNYAFFSVVGSVIVFLIVMSLIISRVILRPLSELLSAIQTLDPDQTAVNIKHSSDTELGVLVESFNDLLNRVDESQGALREKIGELEKANLEIREAQSRLVHAAKMASLGQLVAGVAHELNNPISFIYSNMTHLKEYSDKLIKLIEVAQTQPTRLEKEMREVELDYIIKDLPKLISSCEDGARRTRDIVLGLRNFSRLEEAKLKEVDIHEGLEATLQLLGGELKNRVEVTKDFGDLPAIRCYPTELNQVFMNILSNAAQAIEGKGQITIKTRKAKKEIEVSIKDTGKGMEREVLEQIFDPFFTTKGLGQGTGLGLSISYGIVQKHGGEIDVRSEPGQGTEFVIRLPIKGPIES